MQRHPCAGDGSGRRLPSRLLKNSVLLTSLRHELIQLLRKHKPNSRVTVFSGAGGVIWKASLRSVFQNTATGLQYLVSRKVMMML